MIPYVHQSICIQTNIRLEANKSDTCTRFNEKSLHIRQLDQRRVAFGMQRTAPAALDYYFQSDSARTIEFYCHDILLAHAGTGIQRTSHAVGSGITQKHMQNNYITLNWIELKHFLVFFLIFTYTWFSKWHQLQINRIAESWVLRGQLFLNEIYAVWAQWFIVNGDVHLRNDTTLVYIYRNEWKVARLNGHRDRTKKKKNIN